MLAALVLIGIAVFLKATNRKGWMLYAPMATMLAVTFTAIVLNVINNVKAYMAGTAVFLVNGMQLIMAVFLIVLGLVVAVTCIKTLVETGRRPAERKYPDSNKEAA
jgi:carbon starvation protein